MSRTDVTISLISHTNVGKTTLARTLLRRDVGEVEDRAHVTESSEAHTLIETDSARLRLWDTPGFGDSARLHRRLRSESNPLGWFLGRVWDRLADRPLYCSQQAVRNVRDEADLVLYLVNAAEDPRHAGYVEPELAILAWMDRPVVLLLNQVPDEPAECEERWRETFGRAPVVRKVMTLDAFSRCWVEENVLLDALADLVAPDKREAMASLADAWRRRNLSTFDQAVSRIATYLEETARDREEQPVSDKGSTLDVLGDVSRIFRGGARPSRRARRVLSERLDRRTLDLMELLIELHGLEGESAATIERQVQDYQLSGAGGLDSRAGALAGAVVSGAAGGLAADVLSGGLTLGGGLIAGGILGALGGSAIARGYRLVAGDARPSVGWTADFLERLTGQAILRYLAVATFGRGRGRYRDGDPSRWATDVAAGLERHRDVFESGFRGETPLGPSLRELLSEILTAAYPAAERALASTVGDD